MAEGKETSSSKAEDKADDQVGPVHADASQVGVSTVSDEADPAAGKDPKGLRRDADGRALYPWEVDPKKQAGPAGHELRKRS